MTENIENKVYKEIANIRGRIILGILHRANISEEYHKENIDECYKSIQMIGNKDRWDYCGISNKEDLIKLELLEKLVEDEK